MPAILQDSRQLCVAEFIDLIPTAQNTVNGYESDAYPRRSFRKHTLQVVGTAGGLADVATVYGTLLPLDEITVPFVAGEWVSLGTCSPGALLNISGSYTAMRLKRELDGAPETLVPAMRAMLHSYELENRFG